MLQTMHTLKSYYWVVKPERENGVSLKGLDINRPSEADIVTIRLVLFDSFLGCHLYLTESAKSLYGNKIPLERHSSLKKLDN